jgi:hypothetical protein
LFYAPIAGTPRNPGSPTAAADANLVAFGSIRPWISTTFGGGWQSIPNNTLAGNRLDGPIRSLTFASISPVIDSPEDSKFYLTELKLYDKKIEFASARDKKKGPAVIIEEAPSIFLPKIVVMARVLKER